MCVPFEIVSNGYAKIIDFSLQYGGPFPLRYIVNIDLLDLFPWTVAQ